MARVQDLSPLERRLFDWLSRRSDSFLVILPFAVFLGLGLLGIVAVSTIARRSPLGDTYVTWLITLLVLAALVLYLAAAYAWTAVLLRTRRFRLLELHQTMRDIQAMSWREFEDLVAANYVAKGYAVEPLGGDGPDGGVDLIARKDNLTWLVQCKHYRDQWVGERPLRELLGVVTARGAAGGVLVACGVFDEKALAFVKGSTKLELIGGEQLRELVADAVRTKNSGTVCPSCGSQMREKTGRFGPFLGCSNFPTCHGWRPIPSEAKPS
jgi:restriction system protein